MQNRQAFANQQSKRIEKNEPIKVMDLDINLIIDCDTAIKGLGMDYLFYTMLEKFEDMLLNKEMKQLAIEFQKRDWEQIKHAAHNMKGSAGYIGASRLHYACYYMQYFFVHSDFDQMVEIYPLIVESAIEVKVESRHVMARRQNKQAIITPQVETTDIAEGYRIVKQDGQYFCLHGNQTVEERRLKYIEQMKKPSSFQGSQGVQQSVQNTNQTPTQDKSVTNTQSTPNVHSKVSNPIQTTLAPAQSSFSNNAISTNNLSTNNIMSNNPSSNNIPQTNEKQQVNSNVLHIQQQMSQQQQINTHMNNQMTIIQEEEKNNSSRHSKAQSLLMLNLKEVNANPQQQQIEVKDSSRQINLVKNSEEFNEQMRQISNKSKSGLEKSHRRDRKDTIESQQNKEKQANGQLYTDQQKQAVDDCSCIKAICPAQSQSQCLIF
eukprot:403355130